MRKNMGLYRGKRKDNGKWVEGAFLHLNVGRDFICDGTVWIGTLQPVKYEVDPETVGQFIGLTDKNGKKIFEWDIVTFRTSTSTFKPLYVRWHYETARFLVTTADCIRSYPMDEVWQYEIIGNIHDNPELLEVSK